MLRCTLPASVSPCWESQACLYLVDSKNKLGGGSRAGERDGTCSSPPLPRRCPNAQHRNEAEPVLCTRGAAASTRHPGDRREGLRPRMLLQDVAGAQLQAIWAAWLTLGSLQGKPSPRADPAPCWPCAGGQVILGVTGPPRAEGGTEGGSAPQLLQLRPSKIPTLLGHQGWGRGHSAGCDPLLPHTSNHGVWLCLCHAQGCPELPAHGPEEGHCPSEPAHHQGVRYHLSVHPSTHLSIHVQRCRGRGQSLPHPFLSQHQPINISHSGHCWYEGSGAGTHWKGSVSTQGDLEQSHQPTSSPCGDTMVPGPLPSAETWLHSPHFQSIHSRDLIPLGPFPIGAEQQAPCKGRKGRAANRQTDRAVAKVSFP